MALNRTDGVTSGNGVFGTPQRIEKKYDENGNLLSISVFKDVNGDGKLDLYKVSVFGKFPDGTQTERTVVDENGDGYNDTKLDVISKNGRILSEREFIEEDINSVKSRPHMEHEIYNRKMTTHESGIYMI